MARRSRNHRRRVAVLDRLAAFRHVVEECEETIVVLLSKRIVFVVMAAGTRERQAEPDCGGRIDTIDDVLDGVFLGDDATLGVASVVAIEAGGNALIERWRWQ